jgi:hypothetical protein
MPQTPFNARLDNTRPASGLKFLSGQNAESVKTSAWLIAVLIYLVLSLALCWPWLSGRVTIPWDAKAHFQAQAAFLAQAIHEGQSPFWAPYVFGGHPQIADPQSLIFSPPYLLLALFTANPTFAELDGVAFATLVFGGLGIFGFGRDRHWHPAAALVAALAFAFGGSAAWRIQHIDQITTIAFFPWALWMLERGLRLHSARYGALAGGFAALVCAGPDQVVFLSLVCLAGYTLAHWFTGPGRRRRMRMSLRPLIAGAVIGAVLVLPQLMMVLSFAEGSNRSHITLEGALRGSLHPANFVTFFISNLFGTIGPLEDFWGAPSEHWNHPMRLNIARNMGNLYFGMIPALALVGWFCNGGWLHHRRAALGALFVVMMCYALGRYTPVFPLFYHYLPGTDLFRRPADALFLVSALGAILAGFGLDRWLKRDQALPVGMIVGCALALIAAFSAALGLAVWLGKLRAALPEMAISALIVGTSLGVLVAARRFAMRAPLLVTLLLGVAVAGDLAWSIRPNDSTGLPPENYRELRAEKGNETIDWLKANVVQQGDQRDRIELAGLGFDWPNASLIHKLENTLGYNPLRVGFYSQATGAGDHIPYPEARKFTPLMPGYRAPLARLLGLRFIASPVPLNQIDPDLTANPLKLVKKTRDGFIYENPDTYPRVMVVGTGWTTDQAQLIKTGNWPSTRLDKIAFVEPSAIPLPQDLPDGTAKILRYENTEVEVEVNAPDGGILLLNDTWHPWWFATVDGLNARILRANGIFRAVVLPRGARRVVFRFEPIRGLFRRTLVHGAPTGDEASP